MHPIRVVIFDCDGVMFDTSRSNREYYNRILRHFGKPDMTPAQFAYAHMHTVDEALAHLFEEPGLLAAAAEYRRQMSYLPFLEFMEIEPGLKPLLHRLRPHYRTAIATNRTDTMNRVLQSHALENLFDLVVTAVDVERPKPHPDQLFKILDHFQVQPDQALYIGDSSLDEMAAAKAGVAFVAYANRSLTARHHIDRLKQLEDILPSSDTV
jgi:phosphoglycolate phosphatase